MESFFFAVNSFPPSPSSSPPAPPRTMIPRSTTSRSSAHRAQCSDAVTFRIHAVAPATSSVFVPSIASRSGCGTVTRNGHAAPPIVCRTPSSHRAGETYPGSLCTSAANASWDSSLARVSVRAVPRANIHSTSRGKVSNAPPL